MFFMELDELIIKFIWKKYAGSARKILKKKWNVVCRIDWPYQM